MLLHQLKSKIGQWFNIILPEHKDKNRQSNVSLFFKQQFWNDIWVQVWSTWLGTWYFLFCSTKFHPEPHYIYIYRCVYIEASVLRMYGTHAPGVHDVHGHLCLPLQWLRHISCELCYAQKEWLYMTCCAQLKVRCKLHSLRNLRNVLLVTFSTQTLLESVGSFTSAV